MVNGRRHFKIDQIAYASSYQHVLSLQRSARPTQYFDTCRLKQVAGSDAFKPIITENYTLGCVTNLSL